MDSTLPTHGNRAVGQRFAQCIAWSLLSMVLGCGGENPFDQVQVAGVVTYEDGSLIPGEYVELEFIPQTPPKDVRTHARPGRASVEPSTGKFDTVTSHKYGDGVATGKHKVLVYSLDDNRRPTGAVPAKYQKPETTPLEVETAEAPFQLKVDKN